MNTNIARTLKLSTALMLMITLFTTGCKKVFDEPPYPDEPDLTANLTIAELKQNYPNSEEIDEDIILKALVVGDDRSGNIYKKIVVQDQSGAIEIQIDANNIFNSFPVGSWVYIKVKGLSIGKYNDLPQLGLGIINNQAQRIPSAVMGNYLVRSYSTDVINPLPLKINELTDQHLNMLVELQDVQFATAELKKTYANASNPGGTQNRIIEDCDGNNITARMSDYASFASDSVAKLRGTIIGIYSKFGSTKQFTIRNLDDVAGLTQLRCDGSDGTGEANLNLISIAELRSRIDLANTSSGYEITLPTGEKIKGVVISSPSNENNLTLRVQEPNGAGIFVFIPAGSNPTGNLSAFTTDQEVEINTSNMKLGNFQGDYQLTANYGNIKLTGNTQNITPRVITNLEDLETNFDTWSSTLVKVEGDFVVSKSGSTGNITYTLTSKTNSNDRITSFVRSGLGYEFPTTVSSITGYLSKFNNANQINIRTGADVVEGDGVVPAIDFIEVFTTGTKAGFANGEADLSSGKYYFADALIGTDANDIKISPTSRSARIRGSNSNEGSIYTMFDLTGVKTIEIQHAQTNFNEQTGTTASWELQISTDEGVTWTKFGDTVVSEKGVLKTETFNLNHNDSQVIRFKIKNTSSTSTGGNLVRLNIASIQVTF